MSYIRFEFVIFVLSRDPAFPQNFSQQLGVAAYDCSHITNRAFLFFPFFFF